MMTSNLATEAAPPAETRRFRAKREAILAAAATLINEHGAKGTTLSAVAREVGLNTTSVTYYFKRKDALAAACFQRALGRYDEMIAEAEREAEPRARVRRLIALNLGAHAAVKLGTEAPTALLSDIRAMDEPIRSEIIERYRQVFERVRGWFGEGGTRRDLKLRTARAHVLMESLFWVDAWIGGYDIEDYPRVGARMSDVLEGGLAGDGADWSPTLLALEPAADESEGRRNFLVAATRLISERGYRGASVERIASELGVTKGSFYHHLEAKDDLVLRGFRRSFETITRTQRCADEAGGSHWQRLAATLASLIHHQFTESGPLMRTTALQALPPQLRPRMVGLSNRVARRFAGTISDGIAEGSVRAVDPIIAAQAIMAMLNAAFEMKRWASTQDLEDAVALYASTIGFGLFAPPR